MIISGNFDNKKVEQDMLQSLPEVVGTHVVLDCKWIITVFYTQYRSPPPPQSMLLQPKHIKPDEKWDTTLNRGRGGLTFVEIQRFCGICPKTFETDCTCLSQCSPGWYMPRTMPLGPVV